MAKAQRESIKRYRNSLEDPGFSTPPTEILSPPSNHRRQTSSPGESKSLTLAHSGSPLTLHSSERPSECMPVHALASGSGVALQPPKMSLPLLPPPLPLPPTDTTAPREPALSPGRNVPLETLTTKPRTHTQSPSRSNDHRPLRLGRFFPKVVTRKTSLRELLALRALRRGTFSEHMRHGQRLLSPSFLMSRLRSSSNTSNDVPAPPQDSPRSPASEMSPPPPAQVLSADSGGLSGPSGVQRNRSRRSVSRSSLNQPQVITGAAGGATRHQEASLLVGRHGPFQATAFHFGLLAAFVFPFHSMPMETFLHDIDHWCARPDNLGNTSLELWKSQMIPRGADGEYSRCRMYAEWNSTDITTVPCTQWEYGPSKYGTSIVKQFDIVCERAWLLPVSGAVFSAGVICALLICGPLADWIGRKPVIQFSVVVLQTASLMILFTGMLNSFLAMRFLQGVAATTLFHTSFVLVVESLAPNYRTLYSMAVLMGYMCGSVVVAFLMVLQIGWKSIQVFSMLPGLMMLTLFSKIVESPRWLMARGSLEAAEAVIIYAVTLNGENIIEARQLWARTRREIERDRSDRPAEVCCSELFHVQGSFRRSTILFYCWTVMPFAVQATELDMNSLNFHPSLMLVLGALLSIPAEICAIVFAARLGRRASQAWGLAWTAVVCFVISLISEEHVTTKVALLLTASLSVKASLSIAMLYTAEVYPTVARCSGLGLCNCFATAANTAMPLFAYMHVLPASWVLLSLVSLLCFAGAVLALQLPQTKDCAALPDRSWDMRHERTNLEQGVPLGDTSPHIMSPRSPNFGDRFRGHS